MRSYRRADRFARPQRRFDGAEGSRARRGEEVCECVDASPSRKAALRRGERSRGSAGPSRQGSIGWPGSRASAPTSLLRAQPSLRLLRASLRHTVRGETRAWSRNGGGLLLNPLRRSLRLRGAPPNLSASRAALRPRCLRRPSLLCAARRAWCSARPRAPLRSGPTHRARRACRDVARGCLRCAATR